MKENKNLVFALASFSQATNKEFKQDGLLLFPDEHKAMDFLDLCKSVRVSWGTPNRYEKHTWIKVNDFIGDKVSSQKNFFVNKTEHEELSEEDKEFIEQNTTPFIVEQIKPEETVNT